MSFFALDQLCDALAMHTCKLGLPCQSAFTRAGPIPVNRGVSRNSKPFRAGRGLESRSSCADDAAGGERWGWGCAIVTRLRFLVQDVGAKSSLTLNSMSTKLGENSGE